MISDVAELGLLAVAGAGGAAATVAHLNQMPIVYFIFALAIVGFCVGGIVLIEAVQRRKTKLRR
jgi:hypothetical protein